MQVYSPTTASLIQLKIYPNPIVIEKHKMIKGALKHTKKKLKTVEKFSLFHQTAIIPCRIDFFTWVRIHILTWKS